MAKLTNEEVEARRELYFELWGREEAEKCERIKRRNLRLRGGEALVYLVQFSQRGDQYLKVGITEQTIEDRFRAEAVDNVTVIAAIPMDSRDDAYMLEQVILRMSSSWHVTPEIEFGGSKLECRSVEAKDMLTRVFEAPFLHRHSPVKQKRYINRNT